MAKPGEKLFNMTLPIEALADWKGRAKAAGVSVKDLIIEAMGGETRAVIAQEEEAVRRQLREEIADLKRRLAVKPKGPVERVVYSKPSEPKKGSIASLPGIKALPVFRG